MQECIVVVPRISCLSGKHACMGLSCEPEPGAVTTVTPGLNSDEVQKTLIRVSMVGLNSPDDYRTRSTKCVATLLV
jgi:hypothetical protein